MTMPFNNVVKTATGFRVVRDDETISGLLDAVRRSNMMPQDIRILCEEVERLRSFEKVYEDLYQAWLKKQPVDISQIDARAFASRVR